MFQRTPTFSVPARNAPADPASSGVQSELSGATAQNHRLGMGAGFGDLRIEPHPGGPVLETAAGKSDTEIRALLEKTWRIGGANFIGTIADTIDESGDEPDRCPTSCATRFVGS